MLIPDNDLLAGYRGDLNGRDEAEINREMYERSRDAQRRWADNAAEDLEYYNGAHWTAQQRSTLLERGQQPIAIQTTYKIVEQAVAMMTANRPGFRAAPRETTDREMANVWSDLFQWMWQQSRGQDRLRQIVRDYYVMGRGVAYAYVDPDGDFGKGEVMMTSLHPLEVLPDPRCTDVLWDDAAYVLVRRLMTIAQIEELWPGMGIEVRDNGKAHYRDDEYPWHGSNQQQHEEIVHPHDITEGYFGRRRFQVIERFQKVKRYFWRIWNPQTAEEEVLSDADYQERLKAEAYIVMERGMERIVIEPEAVEQMDQMYDQLGPIFHMMETPGQVDQQGQYHPGQPVPMPGPEHAGSIPGSQVDMIPVTVGQLVDQGVIPSKRFIQNRVKVVQTGGGILLREPFELPTAHYPVIPFPATHNRNPYPISDVTRVRDLQDLINKTQSLILAWQANSTNLKVFYPTGGVKNVEEMERRFNKAGTAFIPYDPAYSQITGQGNGGIQLVQPPQMPGELFANVDRAIGLMEQTMGIYDPGPGAIPDRQPFQTTLLSEERQGQRIKHKLDQIYEPLGRLGAVMLDFAQATYTSEKVFRLLGPSGEIKETAVNQMFIDDITAEVKKFNDVTVGTYDVMILTGSTLPSNRWGRLRAYLEMYDRKLVDDIAVLRQSEIPDAEAILERNSLYAKQADALEQYQQELKKMQGDMQTIERELGHEQRQVEIEKFKRTLQGLEGQVANAASNFRTRLQKEEEKYQAVRTVQQKQQPAAETNNA